MTSPASKIARQTLLVLSLFGVGVAAALGSLIMTQMSGCCGGPPSGTCDFVETIDASADASILCGGEVCQPGVTQCCFQEAGPVFMCMPVGTSCPGQASLCDGDEDCGSGRLHCCALSTMNQVRCQATCPGLPGSGTFQLCHSPSDCPPELPICQSTDFMGHAIRVCSVRG